MKLDSNTINELVELLRPLMEDERNRRPLLILALGNDAPVLQHITWSGSAASFIPEMVCKLADYSEVGSGRQALWALLEYVSSQAQVGVDVQERIEKLRPFIDLRSHSDASTDTSSGVETPDIDVLVQKVRSRLHNDIQSLHGTMPLWGVDRWVPLGDLFVDVNILEELSSSCRSELNDLWQDFSENPSYRSLDRIGLGKEWQRVLGLEVLAKNTNLMVVGKPGSGKTTYLQRVVTECNGGNLQAHRIPVLIKLREFVEDGREVAYSLERYLDWCWRLSDAETQLVLARGRALVLLDGLDEVTGEDGKKIAYEIKRFARAYPQVQVIVTCRTQSQESRFERFDYVEVADFNEPQVRAFAQHWFKTVMGDESAGLARAGEFLEQLFLEENKPIRELAITPILLSLTCAVFHQTGKFYSKRSKLYEEGLELLLEQWDKSREIERDEIYRDLSVERKLELLSYLAVKKFEQPQYVLFEQAELEGYIAEFLGIGKRDSRVVLRAIESQHGLLIERAQKVWSFSHLTFQEYLVAKYFFDMSDFEGLLCHITKPNYREVFLVSCMIWDVNKLLPLMKKKIDKILALDSRLQQFLTWISRRSVSYHSSDKSAAIRAFYYSLVSTIADWLDLMISRIFYLKIYPNLEIAHYLFNGLSYALEYPIYIERLKKIDRTLNDSDDREHPIDYRLTVEYQYELNVEYQRSLAIAIDSSIEYISTIEFDSDLFKLLQEIKDKTPNTKGDRENFISWWDFKSKFLLKEFEYAIEHYFKNYQKWSLTKKHEKLLQQYYDANKLLVDCLNSNYSISEKIRQEIEDTLLLPIAEIENYSSIQDNFG